MKVPIGNDVSIDIPRLIETRLLVQANSGGGKSWALRRILEQTHGHVQQLVIDPEGEFASLREKFDYVLASRTGGDTLADPRTAKLLAERLLELGVSAVIDIYELAPQERKRFVRLFLEALVDAPKQLWHPALVVLDEAHVYCPEGDTKAECSDAVKSLATRGRKRGFCAVFATQRLSKFAKDAAAECNNKLIGRTSIDIDMKRAADELGFVSREERLSLRDLRDGEFYAFGPAMTRQVTRFQVGTVQTTHPKAGSHLAAVVPPPTAKVRALLPKLSDLPAEAASREKTLESLKQEVADLNKQLRATQSQSIPPEKLNEARDKGYREAHADILKAISVQIYKLKHVADTLHVCQEQVSEAFRILCAVPIPTTKADTTTATSPGMKYTPKPPLDRRPDDWKKFTASPPPKPLSGHSQHGGLSQAHFRVLRSLFWLKDEEATPAKVAFYANYTVNGHFTNTLSSLRSSGYAQGWQITQAGIDVIKPLNVEEKPTGSELREWLRAKLSGAENKILDVLILAEGRRLDTEELARRSGYTVNGHFTNCLSRLRSLEIAEGYERDGGSKANDVFFE